MPKVNEIKTFRKLEIHRVRIKKYIWLLCEDCDRGKWIEFYKARAHSFKNLCVSCNLRRRYPNPQNYKLLRIYPSDPYYCMADKRDWIQEHRLVMARHLKRPLSINELVHHKNGDKRNNKIENLKLTERNNHPRKYLDAYTEGYEQGFRDASKLNSY